MNGRPYITALALAMTSCDTFYGIQRETDITALPHLQQLKAAISAVEGVDRVTYKRYGGTSASDVFFYSGTNDISGRVTLATDAAGKKTITVGFIRSNMVPSQEVIDRNYAVMLTVQDSIEKNCGLTGLRASMKESSSPELKHKEAQQTPAFYVAPRRK